MGWFLYNGLRHERVNKDWNVLFHFKKTMVKTVDSMLIAHDVLIIHDTFN